MGADAHARQADRLPRGNQIAVIGMNGRFPQARNLDEFWANLRDGVECSIEVSAEDLSAAGEDPASLESPDYVRRVFALEDAEHFDAEHFGFSPVEARMLDPQHRLLLESAAAALDHAGYDPERYPGLIAVFGGVGRNSHYMHALSVRPELIASVGEYHSLIGNERDFPTTHISYRLNLRGPSVDVQTACSTSGVALHLACQSLRAGECDIALAGGAKVIVPNRTGYWYVEGGPLSPEGRIRAFDADAKGMVRGSGAAMIVLKRLEDAIEDGDTIHAVVLGSAVNNDGSGKVGFTAPSVAGQAAVIAEAMSVAGVTGDEVSYVETHGTGTILGDPIEIAGLTDAYRATTDAVGFCRIGSVKTNIGHLDAGATAAGIIKTILALEHEQLPPSLNFERPNPQIDFGRSPFRVNDTLTPWPRASVARRAGVSSFGLGGTNAHIVLEEAPVAKPTAAGAPFQVLVLSARTPTALETATDDLARHLRAHPDVSLADAAYTLAVGRREWPHRRAVACADVTTAAAALERRDARTVSTFARGDTVPETVFMFPGEGAPYPGMTAGLCTAEPVFRAALEQCDALLSGHARDALLEMLHPKSVVAQSTALERRDAALPALFAVEYGLARLWQDRGVVPSSVIGHGVGEYAAACLAGVFSLENALRLVVACARRSEHDGAGAMIGVPLSTSDLAPFLDERHAISAINRALTQSAELPMFDACVVSGSADAIAELRTRLAVRSIDASRIEYAAAEGSDGEATRRAERDADFAAVARFVEYSAPRIQVVSSVTGSWLSDEEATDPVYWIRQASAPVRFGDGLTTLLSGAARAFLEVGPGRALSNFARQHPLNRGAHVVASSTRHRLEKLDDGLVLADALGRLWAGGVDVDWDTVHAGSGRRRIPLPTYPFERRRYSLADDGAGGEDRGRLAASRAGHSASVAGPLPPGSSEAAARVDEVASGAFGSVATPAHRRALLVAELRGIVQELSGIGAEQLDADSTFIELGFDSLFLTRANGAFRKRFRARLTTRQLMEATPTLNALAAHLEEQLPADFYVESPAPAQVEAAAKPDLVTAPEGESVPAAPDKTSPWQPIAKHAAERELTDEQQAWLDALIGRVTARTPASKALTQKNRQRLADPRTVQGFRRRWKEMVYPIVSDSAQGSRIRDIDGNEYIDLVNGYGVTFFGHSAPFILDAARAQLERTIAIGPQTELAGEVASLVCELTGMERAAFCNTGSEAVLAAIRSARTVTGKTKLATFAGHYHGIFDEVLIKAVGTGAERRAVPTAPGVPQGKLDDIVVLEYGNMESLEAIRRHADDLALVMVEPVRSRNLDLQPREFLHALRELTAELRIPLLFDEMVTGFRAGPGGAQEFFGVRADIATYGKIIGGEFPIGVVAGRAEYLDTLDGGMWTFGDESVPEADMTWFAGTFVRHPLALAAARAVLTRFKQEGPALQEGLNRRTSAFVRDLNEYFSARSAPIRIEHFSSAFFLNFTSYQEYSPLLFYELHTRGVYTFEGRPAFLTLAHSEADLAHVAGSLKEAVAELQELGFLSGGAPKPDRPSLIPLDEGQQEIWLATRLGEDASRAYNLANTLRLRGALHVNGLHTAVQRLIARHEALRAVPEADGQSQRILPTLEIAMPLYDLSDLEGGERERRLESLQDAEVETPFDLDQGPLVRVRLIRLGADDHLFIMTVHHLIADGWSCGVLVRDLAKLYEADVTGRQAQLGPVMQLGEYVRHSTENRESGARREAEEYWLGEFAGSLPVLELPTDRPRPARKTFRARRLTQPLAQTFVDRVRRLAIAQGSTLFGTLLAGYTALLHRLSGQDDIVVGFSLAGQSNITDRDLVGHCVTFLPLRLRPTPEATFSEFARGVRGSVLDAVEHQNFAFGELLRRLHVQRDPSRSPLMSVAFNLDPSGQPLEFHGLDALYGSVPRKYENFDIFFNVVELGEDRLEIQCTFNLDLFDEETIRQWIGHLLALLTAAADSPDTALGDLPLTLVTESPLLAAGPRG